MRYFIIFIPAIICFIASCKSPSDRVFDKFKEVNEDLKSLDSMIAESDHKMDSMTKDLKFVGFDPVIADSLRKLFNQTSVYLSILKGELNNADATGEEPDAAETLLLKTQKGDSLYNYMMSVYNAGIKYGDSISQQRYIPLTKYNKEDWLKRYFKNVPTVAAITILSKFRHDLVDVKMTLMSADIRELKNKILSE